MKLGSQTPCDFRGLNLNQTAALKMQTFILSLADLMFRVQGGMG